MRKLGIIISIIILTISSAYSQNPDWVVNSALYSSEVTIVAQIKLDNVFLGKNTDRIAAFDGGGQIKGVTSLFKSNITQTYFAFLTVYSNSSGEELFFKIYDSTSNTIINVENQTYIFNAGDTVGSIDNPFLIEATRLVLHLNKLDSNVYNYIKVNNSSIDIEMKFDITNCQLFDFRGNKVFSKNYANQTTKFSVNTKIYNSGIYLLSVKSKSNIFLKKIFIH